MQKLWRRCAHPREQKTSKKTSLFVKKDASWLVWNMMFLEKKTSQDHQVTTQN